MEHAAGTGVILKEDRRQAHLRQGRRRQGGLCLREFSGEGCECGARRTGGGIERLIHKDMPSWANLDGPVSAGANECAVKHVVDTDRHLTASRWVDQREGMTDKGLDRSIPAGCDDTQIDPVALLVQPQKPYRRPLAVLKHVAHRRIGGFG